MAIDIRVLYIHAESSNADFLTRHFEVTDEHYDVDDERLDVVTTTSGAEALELLSRNECRIDCIVSEYELTGTTGIDLFEVVRREHEPIPFVLVHDGGSEEIAVEAIRAGVTDYVRRESLDQDGTGPMDETLLTRIRDAVAQYRANSSTERTETHSDEPTNRQSVTPTNRLSAKPTNRQSPDSTDRLSTDQFDRWFQVLVEKSNDVLWMYAADWSELIFVNSVVEEIFGLSPETLRAQPRAFLDAVHPDDREAVEDSMARLSAGHSESIEYRIDEDKDFRRWVWAQAEPVFAPDGTVDRVVGIVRDVTERKERERALAALNDVAVDLDTCDTVSAICERSIEASEAILQFDLSIIDIEEDGYLSKAAISEEIDIGETTTMSIDEGIAGKTYRTGESMLIDDLENHPEANPQGPFRAAISLPLDDHGIFQAVSTEPGTFDETDLELAELLGKHTTSALDQLEREQQLHRQNEQLEEFSRIVSHDLRNPLNVLEGNIELAREECELEYLDHSVEVLARMESIIDDTLMLASNGQIVDEKTTVSLGSIARDCWQNVSTDAATLDVHTDRSIDADPDRLRHIFENLFRNAVEHGGTDVTVHVGTFEDGFYVEDDGPGIPDEHREHVFETGYSAHGNSGLGLAIVRQIASAHGWEVAVTAGVDGGARFEFVDRNILPP